MEETSEYTVKQEKDRLALNKRRVCCPAGTLVPRGWTGKVGSSWGPCGGPWAELGPPSSSPGAS